MKDFIKDFYDEYGFYPPKNINSWEEWNESQEYIDYLTHRASLPREFDSPIWS